jgi:dienelactone hydrolase
VAESKIERLFVAGGVERVPVRHDGLVGTLFRPAGSGPFPGVLVFTGSGGGIDEGRAALLASHGFAAFALAYFNADGLPDNLIDIPLEYFETGLQWMASRSEVDGNRIGITGQSRGGELVLLLASIFPSIRAVVAGVPSAVVWGGFGKGTDEMQPPPVAWTHGGKPVLAMPGARGGFHRNVFNLYPLWQDLYVR